MNPGLKEKKVVFLYFFHVSYDSEQLSSIFFLGGIKAMQEMEICSQGSGSIKKTCGSESETLQMKRGSYR